jgi:hypothetical protein
MNVSWETLNKCIPKDGSRHFIRAQPSGAGYFEVYWDIEKGKYILPWCVTGSGTYNLKQADEE